MGFVERPAALRGHRARARGPSEIRV